MTKQYNLAKCLGCQEKTGHSSGFCEKCRTMACIQCGVRFVLMGRMIVSGETRCVVHRRQGK